MARICNSIQGLGLKIGESQATPDSRICLPKMGVQVNVGSVIDTSGPIIYPESAIVNYPESGTIIYP